MLRANPAPKRLAPIDKSPTWISEAKMTDFLTRVELHGATTEDYAALDRAMAAVNFSKTIVSSRGLSYAMPTATYFSQAAGMSAADVRNLAIGAARGLGLRYDVITSAGETSFALHPSP